VINKTGESKRERRVGNSGSNLTNEFPPTFLLSTADIRHLPLNVALLSHSTAIYYRAYTTAPSTPCTPTASIAWLWHAHHPSHSMHLNQMRPKSQQSGIRSGFRSHPFVPIRLHSEPGPLPETEIAMKVDTTGLLGGTTELSTL
jgi:hypothetical protein